eukprot:TRINITY_DN11788_c0_g1_i1.p1 TRINITY_DN11788_c0_g1~~TRINITY_DN11788_c0_g1_i1.p1  ORF type:complete len:320 (+),score=100.00 TRINITY_DN11788_c0_g1_i1:39-998(+)
MSFTSSSIPQISLDKILLPKQNNILAEVVASKIKRDATEKLEPYDCRLYDQDDVSYRIQCEEKAPNLMVVSMKFPVYAKIKDVGAEEAFKRIYGSLATTPQEGFDLALQVDLESKDIVEEKAKDDLIQKIASFKLNVLGGLFDYFLTPVLKGLKAPAPFSFDLRPDTTIYFCPKNDRCVIVYQMNFSERVDKAIARVFMQEFKESQRSVQGSPPVMWGPTAPQEVVDNFKNANLNNNLGFISFAVLKSHLEKDKKDKAIPVMASFRTYMQYHIKCSKSYFHSRMRARVMSLLTVLNRAKVEQEGVAKKTMSGKTFTRKA